MESEQPLRPSRRIISGMPLAAGMTAMPNCIGICITATIPANRPYLVLKRSNV